MRDSEKSGLTFELLYDVTDQIFSFELLKIFSYCFIVFSKQFRGNKLVLSTKLLLFNIQSINPIQTYTQIIQSDECTI